jgi:diguanylate cyclase (GGDEF)-like protein/PAS domain S-box-containing protein
MHITANVVYIVILILFAGVAVSLAFYIARQHSIRGIRWISGILCISAWMGVAYALQLVADTTTARLFWVQMEYIGIVAIFPVLLIFTLRYTGQTHFLKPPFYLALLIEPAAVLALVWTIPVQNSFYLSYGLTSSGGDFTWQVSYGYMFWLHVLYSTILFMFALGLLASKGLKAANPQRGQAFLFFGLVLIAGLGDVCYITHSYPYDIDFSPILTLVCSILIGLVIPRYRFLEMTPIAFETVLQSMADGVILVDLYGQVTNINPAAELIAGQKLDQPLATPLESLLPELAEKIKALAISVEERLVMQLGPENDRHTFTVTISPVYQENWHIEGRLIILRDVSEANRVQGELEESERRYRSLFEGVPIGHYRATQDGRLLEVNPAFVEMVRCPNRDSLLTKNIFELFQDLSMPAHPQGTETEIRAVQRFDQKLACWDGEQVWVSHTVRVYPDGDGEPIYEGSVEDITHRKEVEGELQASEKKFRSIFDLSPNSILLADLSANIIDCNISTLRLETFASKEEMIGCNFSSVVIPEDHTRFFSLMDTTLEDGGVQGAGLTLLRKDGTRFEAEISTSIVSNSTGRSKRMIITVNDISTRKAAENELQDAQRQLAQRVNELETRTHQITLLTEMSNMLQVCLKPEEAYSFIGKYAAQVFPGLGGVLMILDANKRMLLPQAHWGEMEFKPQPYLPADCWALRSGQAYLAPEDNPTSLCRHFHLQPVSGSLCVPILSAGEIIGVINLLNWRGMGSLAEAQLQLASAMAEQIGLALSNMQLRDNLREQAIHDPLTRLYNRYHLREALESELAISEKTSKPMAVVMIDLDHFKQMNTRYGHLNVDVMLREFGRMMHAFVSNGEVALRYGGDEFVLILPNVTLDQAAERAEQLRRRVRQLTVHQGDLTIQDMTLSIGIAGWPMHGRTFTELLKAADAALFKAKEARDKVEIAQ